jgi:hypothetical protein
VLIKGAKSELGRASLSTVRCASGKAVKAQEFELKRLLAGAIWHPTSWYRRLRKISLLSADPETPPLPRLSSARLRTARDDGRRQAETSGANDLVIFMSIRGKRVTVYTGTFKSKPRSCGASGHAYINLRFISVGLKSQVPRMVANAQYCLEESTRKWGNLSYMGQRRGEMKRSTYLALWDMLTTTFIS